VLERLEADPRGKELATRLDETRKEAEAATRELREFQAKMPASPTAEDYAALRPLQEKARSALATAQRWEGFGRLLREVPLRRATAQVALSRNEADPTKRGTMLDAAQASLDAFLAGKPEGVPAIAAFTQKGNLLLERGRLKAEQAKRPGADAEALRAEAIPFFDAAIKCLQGTIKPDQKDIADVEITNAEDAVIGPLRKVNAEIAALKAEIAGDDGKKAEGEGKKPADKGKKPRATAEQQKEFERLEAVQEDLRARLIQARLLTANAYYEKARAYPADSKEWKQTLAESTKRFQELADKYPNKGGGMFARYYEGRNYALLKDYENAIGALTPLATIEGTSPLAITLRSRALNTMLECLLAQEKYGDFDAEMRKFALTKLPPARLDDEWLGLKYRAAAILVATAAALPEKDRVGRGSAQKDAKALATDVAKANREFAKEARDLLTTLGAAGPAEGERTFEQAMDEARISLTTMREAQVAAKGAAGEAAEKAAAAAGAAREATIARVREALELAGDEGEKGVDIGAVNQARYLLTFLHYDGQQFAEAAALGRTLTEKYPNAMGSPQAAKIALASLQQLQQRGSDEERAKAKADTTSFAKLMMDTWPDQPESADAALIVIAAAVADRDPDALIAIAKQVPKESPRRADVLLRVGTALWREIQEARRRDESDRPDEATLAAWLATARGAIEEGLAGLGGGQAPVSGAAARSVVAGALSGVQMAMEDGDLEKAGRWLEHPVFGPWTVVTGADESLRQGPLAENAYSVALRYFIQAEQIPKAEQAMEGLERLAGTGSEASAKLAAMYLAMGQGLQAQLEELAARGADPQVRERAGRILAGFEKFLDGVSKRDRKTSSQMWVATTYFTLGSGRGKGAVVPKSKADTYLDRSAAVYRDLLARKDDAGASAEERADLERFEPAIRLRLAGILRERGKWDEAIEQLETVISTLNRRNSLDTQWQAAEIIEAAGRARAADGDAAAAAKLLREAAAGRKDAAGQPLIWGWGGIANKLSRQAFAGSDERAREAQSQFFEARLHVAQCLLERFRLSAGADGKPLDKQAREAGLESAASAIVMTRRLYPALGGEAFQRRFEKLLKEIQKELGSANPGGFADVDAQAQPAGPAGGAP